jgi:hypothetical protein
MLSDWVSFLAYPNLFRIKGFVVVVVVVVVVSKELTKLPHLSIRKLVRIFSIVEFRRKYRFLHIMTNLSNRMGG